METFQGFQYAQHTQQKASFSINLKKNGENKEALQLLGGKCKELLLVIKHVGDELGNRTSWTLVGVVLI